MNASSRKIRTHEGKYWCQIEDYVANLEDEYILHIVGCIGPLPDFSRFKRVKILHFSDCEITGPYKYPLPESIKHLSFICTKIGELPPLPSRLDELCVGQTDISRLPPLPHTLTQLSISKNLLLTELPLLPAGLNRLYCPCNDLIRLPKLPPNLFSLTCNKNSLDDLPPLPKCMILVEVSNNPLKFMPYQDVTVRPLPTTLQTKIFSINAIHRFRAAYYCTKYGLVLKQWLWRVREQRAVKQCNPVYLKKCLEYIPDDMFEYATDVIFSLKGGALEASRRFESEFRDCKSIVHSRELAQKILENLANGSRLDMNGR